jgi:hypothetical protein
MADIKHSLGSLSVQFLVIAVALVSLLVAGTVVYHHLEDWSWTTSFYFTVCTVTTIGYGDVVPTTESSRLFTAFFALAGVSVALGSFGIIGANYLKHGQELFERMRSAR